MAKKPLTTEEKLKIINSDPVLWLKNFVKIVNNEGELVPFILNPEQEDFVRNMGKFNIILKARQIGFTTLSLGLMLYYASTLPNTNYLMLSYDVASTQNIFERLKQMYDSMPERYKIPQKRNNKLELLLENGSRISVKVASVKELGRSYSLQMIHCSEFAFYPEEQQEKGLLSLEQALLKNSTSKIIIESTANGAGNHYYRLFNDAMKGKSKYKAFFYNWLGKGASKQFHSEYQEAEQWYRSQNHGVRQDSTDLLPEERKLRELGATFSQLMWRRWKLQDISEEQFNQEYPTIPEQAFISTDKGVFDAKMISDRYVSLPDALGYKDITHELPTSLSQYLNKGLYIYQNVKKNERYYAGIDVSAGLKNDYSAIVILDSNGEQVASFYRNDVPVYKFAKIAYDLGMYYNYCMYLPERNSYGLDLIQRLRKESGYLQVLKTQTWDNFTGRKKWDYGWTTSSVNKTKMINDLKEVFETGLILINDKETLDEMKTFIEVDGKMQNEKNSYHDDLVIALALAVQCLKSGRWYI
ncbi:MAG TPA: DNA packaging protein [Thermoanaerobacterium sp.]|nr:DNA packaging protein [Thermoanaerobacterium sp.]